MCARASFTSLDYYSRVRGVYLKKCCTPTYACVNLSLCMHTPNIDISTPSSSSLLHTDPSSIQAPAQQYALLHSNTTLNCTTTFSETSTIYITWMKNDTNLDNNQIINVDLIHEGSYTCEVYLGHLGGLTMEKNVEFYVIGEW